MHSFELKHSLWPWLAWLVVCMCGLFQFLLQTSSSVMISDLERAFSLNSLGVSFLSSSYFYIYVMCQIPAGIVIDRYQVRRTMFFSLFFLALGCVLFATATNVWTASGSRLWMGLVSAPTFVAAFYLVARTLPEKYFALVAGLTETLGMIGGGAGQVVLARSVMAFGWRHTMLVLAVVALVLSALVYTIIRDHAKIPTKSTSIEHPLPKHVLYDLLMMLKMPAAWINGLFCGLLFGVIAAFGGFWAVPFLMELYGISLGHAADISCMMFIGAALGTPTIGWLSDRLGVRRAIMLLGSSISFVLFNIILFVPVSIACMFVLIFCLGFFSAVYLLPFAVIRDITPPHMRGTAMGYINMMCILIGSPLLQPLIGGLLHAHGQINLQAYQHALIVFPVSLLLAIGLGWFIREGDSDLTSQPSS